MSLPKHDITDENTKTRTLHKVGDDYQPVGKAALSVDHIVNPHPSFSGHKTYSEWVRVAYPGGEGWVDVSSPVVNTWTDADFPDWAGWTLVSDDITPDGQCNSATMKKAKKIRLLILKGLFVSFRWNGIFPRLIPASHG